MSCVYCHSLWISLVGALYNKETTKYPNRIAEPLFGIEANQDIYWDFVISTILDTPHSKCLYFPLTSGRSSKDQELAPQRNADVHNAVQPCLNEHRNRPDVVGLLLSEKSAFLWMSCLLLQFDFSNDSFSSIFKLRCNPKGKLQAIIGQAKISPNFPYFEENTYCLCSINPQF